MPVKAPILPPHFEKESVFEASRSCGKALNLPASCRFVLDQLCASFRGDLTEGRLLVWPSNAYLVEKTGLAERTVRLCLRQLIEQGIIIAKDSPNGKRYAQRVNGVIVRAFGFDLSPLLARLSEFKDRIVAQEDERRDRGRAFDDITIHRRIVQEGLKELATARLAPAVSQLLTRFEELTRSAPRRSSGASPYAARDLWRKLREDTEVLLKDSGSGGKNCRHKDTNTKASEDSCYQGDEVEEALAVVEVLDICSDAMALMGVVRTERDLVAASDRMRGYLGISRSAWNEARQNLGPLMASLVLVYVIQVQAKPAPGSRQIENLGGYFRSICRLVSDKRIDFEEEVKKLARRLQ